MFYVSKNRWIQSYRMIYVYIYMCVCMCVRMFLQQTDVHRFLLYLTASHQFYYQVPAIHKDAICFSVRLCETWHCPRFYKLSETLIKKLLTGSKRATINKKRFIRFDWTNLRPIRLRMMRSVEQLTHGLKITGQTRVLAGFTTEILDQAIFRRILSSSLTAFT